MIKRIIVKATSRNPVPFKWLLNIREEPDGLICLKSINVVKRHIRVPGVGYIESFSPVTIDTSTRILIGLPLYNK